MMSLSDDKQADVIDAFNTTSRYFDDILNINNVYFDNMVNQIYPSELQLNKANTSDTEATFLDLHLSISNDIVSTKIYDKRDNFDFEIVNFPFLDGDVSCSTSYGVYISQLIRFARASSHVTDFNTRNKLLTQKLLKQGYHSHLKTFSKFYRRYYDLISKWEPDKTYRDKTSHAIFLHPRQNIPQRFATSDKTSHAVFVTPNITSHAIFVTPDITSHAIFATPDKTSHTQTGSSG